MPAGICHLQTAISTNISMSDWKGWHFWLLYLNGELTEEIYNIKAKRSVKMFTLLYITLQLKYTYWHAL